MPTVSSNTPKRNDEIKTIYEINSNCLQMTLVQRLYTFSVDYVLVPVHDIDIYHLVPLSVLFVHCFDVQRQTVREVPLLFLYLLLFNKKINFDI